MAKHNEGFRNFQERLHMEDRYKLTSKHLERPLGTVES